MMALVIKPFRAKCKGQILQHNPGERLQIRIKVVPPLVNGGFVRLLEPLDKANEPIAAKIFLKILGEDIWVCNFPAALSLVPPGEVCYMPEEIRALKGATEEEIRQIHMIKKEIGGVLISVKDKGGEA